MTKDYRNTLKMLINTGWHICFWKVWQSDLSQSTRVGATDSDYHRVVRLESIWVAISRQLTHRIWFDWLIFDKRSLWTCVELGLIWCSISSTTDPAAKPFLPNIHQSKHNWLIGQVVEHLSKVHKQIMGHLIVWFWPWSRVWIEIDPGAGWSTTSDDDRRRSPPSYPPYLPRPR